MMAVKLHFLVIVTITFFSQCFINGVSSDSTTSQHNPVLIIPSQMYCPNETHTRCFTLVECLVNTSGCFLSNSVVTFLSGDHHTENVTGFKIIRNKQNLVLKSELNPSVDIPSSRIYCSNRLSLAFVDIHGLFISGLGFYDCGSRLPNELRKEAIAIQTTTYFEFFEGTKMALFVVNVYNMAVNYVHINNSAGYGMFVLNALGNSSISNSAFTYNNWRALSYHQYDPKFCNSLYGIRNKSSCVGGNVVVVFQDTSIPRCSTQPSYFFSISNCMFRHGVNFDYEQWDPPPYYLYAAGGLSIFTGQTIYSVIIEVNMSFMDYNLGHNGGNVVVYIQDPSGADTVVTLANSYITNGNSHLEKSSNVAFAGGLYVYHGDCGCEYLSPCSLAEHLTHIRDLYVINCTFTGNKGYHGGAIRIESVIYDFDDSNRRHLQTSAVIIYCTISNNTGYDAVLKVTETYSGPRDEGRNSYRMKFTLKSSSITNNKLLSLKFMDLVSQEKASMSAIRFFNLKDCRFINNNVSANSILGLLIDSQSIELFGTSHFVGNKGKLGGALFIRNGRIILQKKSNLFITQNRADLGAGIFVDNPRYPFRHPYCFFHFPAGIQFDLLDYPHIEFLNNTAGIAGNSIYGGYLDECVIQELRQRPGVVLFNEIFGILWNNSLTEVSSSVHHLCFCVNNKPKCDIFKQSTSVYPGEQFEISAVAVGQMNGTVPAVVLSEVIQNHSIPASLDFQQDAQQLGTECSPLTYRVKSTENVLVKILMQTSFEKTQRPSDAIFRLLYVNMTECPRGFSLNREKIVCDCIHFLQKRNIVCFIDDQVFERTPPVWIGYQNESKLILAHNSCPLDYCSRNMTRFKLSSVDNQCQFNRSGIICGKCKEGLSVVFGNSQCEHCSNSFIALLLVFVLAGFALVLVLIYCNLTVADGTLNGLIFYVNIVRIHHTILFPSGHTNIVTVIIAWLNLDLGIELCFYNGFDTYTRTWLQFLFPVYVWIIIIIITVASWYSTTVAKIVGSNSIPVLATLLLISYTKLQRTVLESLSFTIIHTNDEDKVLVWIYDGNVLFLGVKHAFLATMACVFLLVFIIPFTAIVLCGPVFQMKCSRMMLKLKVTPINDAYQGPYKVKYRWWTGAMLLIRSILLFLFGVNILGNPRINLLLIVSTCILLLGIMWNFGTVYKQKVVNLIESFHIINLALLAGWSEYNRQGSTDYKQQQAIIVYVFTGSALFAFIIIQTFVKLRLFVKKYRRKHQFHQLETLPEAITFPEQQPALPTVSYVEIHHSIGDTSS